MIDLYLDDERTPPEGWTLVRSVSEAIARLQLGQVRHLSLDHDLGFINDDDPFDAAGAITGYDLCKWMAETGTWPTQKPTVHSANPVGAANMRSVIDRYGPWDRD